MKISRRSFLGSFAVAPMVAVVPVSAVASAAPSITQAIPAASINDAVRALMASTSAAAARRTLGLSVDG